MAGKPPTEAQNGKWEYPNSAKVLESVGLRTIAEYIRKRRSTAMQFIVDRPIHALCLDAERQRGTANRQYWWQLPVDLPSDSSEGTQSGSDDEEEAADESDSSDDSEGVSLVTDDEVDLGL